jgi:DNA/RNA endonuclease YhcR with UshA esterase domain
MKNAHRRLKVFSLIVLATLTVLNPAQAGDTNGTVLAKIDATVANKHYGENVIVAGKIVEVTIRPKVVILNFEQPFPDAPFTGVIFNRSTNQFGDLSSLKGKNVEVRGAIKNYQNKPEMILTNSNQLTISASRPGIEGQASVPLPKQP